MRDKYRRDRVKACELAAQVFASQKDFDIARVWSTVVFFEKYIQSGAAGTQKLFGPKKPVKLKVVR